MKHSCTESAISTTLLTSLAKVGWACHSTQNSEADAVSDEIGRIGDLLGSRAFGRAGALEEIIRPQTTDYAHPRSLSARYGLNELPFHAEHSHRPRPCRYILLGCINPGTPSTDSRLIDWRSLSFSAHELLLLESAPILVRTGRRSFYSTILSQDRTFLRYDPGCLEAVNERGRDALQLVEDRLTSSYPYIHEWRQGDILIIDNWRVLHGRGSCVQNSRRRLVRILINE